jgi:hypothetical protein
MRRARRAPLFLAVALAFGAVAAGCGGDETVVEDGNGGTVEDGDGGGNGGDGNGDGNGEDGDGGGGDGGDDDLDVDVG